MNQRAKRVVLSALTTALAAASLTVVTAPQASAINLVNCDRSDFVHVNGHTGYSPDAAHASWTLCYANAGEARGNDAGLWGSNHWVRSISTGNNRVQWYGDGRWQPSTPINKWTYFSWPNHPNGVDFGGIKIH